MTLYSENSKLNGECYIDSASPNRIWEAEDRNEIHYMSDTNDLETCRAFCTDRSYKYFGVQAGMWCYCGPTVPLSSLRTSSSECSLACPGNSAQICGEQWRMNIYSTDLH